MSTLLPSRGHRSRARGRTRLRASCAFDAVVVEGVADAPVGGGGLAVDAVGVDLEQDGDAVSGAAGDLGGGHAGVQP